MQTRHLPPFGSCRRLIGPALVLLAVALLPRAAAGQGRTGEQIYRQLCVKCHGAAGEGTDEYPHTLEGDRSAAELARLIARTMPKDSKMKCTAEEAEKVAAYIHGTFYAKAAQARNKPPRVELSHLTVRQYRNAAADLLAGFRTPGRWDDRRGLRGEYFKTRRFRNSSAALDRLDPAVRFDFGTASPDADKLDAHEFSIRWSGSVLAPETGPYEFIVRTDHAARLWINDLNRPLIDVWVKSGNDTEYRASLFLLGGRAYPLRLEFSKAKQGVDDSKKQKEKPPPVKASVALEWKPPQQAVEVIPTRNLSPSINPVAFALTSPFPPDDRSFGWERATTVSREWDQATTEAAIETAGYVAAHLDELTGLRPARDAGPGSGNPADINLDGRAGETVPAAERDKKYREFALRFAERAFRRPLTDEQRRLFIDAQFESARDPETAVKRVVLLVLKSPRFLYREVGGGDAYDVASRLSFGLWDSLPDKELLDAAAAGRLATREQVATQAERMLTDLRARSKLRDFFLQWLKVDHAPDVAKDPKRFPGFDEAVASDLRTSLELFLEDVVWSEPSDFRQLLLADSLYLNGRLAKLYGGDLPAEAPFLKVAVDLDQRAGVLTHPYLLAAFAYTAESSPIHRGVFLARGVLGLSLRPPPEAFTPLPPDLHPQLTTRERVALQTRPQSCVTCHAVINPLGFTLEHFDAIGRFRDKEKGRPIDAAGAYQTRTGEVVKFAGVRDLAAFLAQSEEVHDSFVEQLFHHLVKQPIRAYPGQQAELRHSFARSGYNIRRLVVDIMAASALTARGAKP